MDSVSSGSMQSLTDGEDLYDSRDTARARTGNDVGPLANPSPLPPSLHPSPTHLDPFSNFFNPLSYTPSLDNSWPRNPIPERNPIGSMNSQLQAIESNVVLAPKGNLTLKSDSSLAPVRNPRKRARVSRRAPTMVLTTDTSNFRAMVQEFTGIPAPPFTPGSIPSTRLDLFGGISTPSPPNYLLRSFPPNPMPSIFNLPQPNINLAPNTTDSNRNRHLLQPEQSLYGNVRTSTSGDGGGDGASDRALFRFANEKYSTDHSNLNKYSASSSLDIHADHKGLENVTTRSEVRIGSQTWMEILLDKLKR